MKDFSKLPDIEEEYDELEELTDIFDDLPTDKPTKDQLYKMYGIFLNDIVNNPIFIDGVKLSFNRNKSKHPICKGKMQAFEHIITRKNKYKGKRDFDRERANKIHWIRPIINNSTDPRIKFFTRINDEGFNQLYYWYEEKGFMIIIREINPDLLLITSFSVDELNRTKYKEWYNESR